MLRKPQLLVRDVLAMHTSAKPIIMKISPDTAKELVKLLKLKPDDIFPDTGRELLETFKITDSTVLPSIVASRDVQPGDNALVADAKRRAAAAASARRVS